MEQHLKPDFDSQDIIILNETIRLLLCRTLRLRFQLFLQLALQFRCYKRYLCTRTESLVQLLERPALIRHRVRICTCTPSNNTISLWRYDILPVVVLLPLTVKSTTISTHLAQAYPCSRKYIAPGPISGWHQRTAQCKHRGRF